MFFFVNFILVVDEKFVVELELLLGVNVFEVMFKWWFNYVFEDMFLNVDKDFNNWFYYGKDYQGICFSQLCQIISENVNKFVLMWNFFFGVNDVQDSQMMVVNG